MPHTSWTHWLGSDACIWTTVLNPYYDMNGTITFSLTAQDNFGCLNTGDVDIWYNRSLMKKKDTGDVDVGYNRSLRESSMKI